MGGDESPVVGDSGCDGAAAFDSFHQIVTQIKCCGVETSGGQEQRKESRRRMPALTPWRCGALPIS